MKLKLYMAVTNDRYELPVFIEDKPETLCKKTGVSYNKLMSHISYNHRVGGKQTGKKKSKYIFVRIEVDE